MTDTHDSYLQSDARQEAISAQKELFLRGLPVDTTVVSDFVLRSWQRSRLAGVDPETTVRKKVDETIFRHILAANADLLESSRVIMKELFSSLVSGAGSFPPPNASACIWKPAEGTATPTPVPSPA